jgi:X-Pro dipeptidyl-peptidase
MRRLLVVVLGVVVGIPVLVTGAGPAAATTGGTRPVYDYSRAIRERLTVETTVDSDHDGRRDRVAIRVIRPRETAKHRRIPVIFQPSPYYAGLNDVPNHNDIDRDMIDKGAAPPRADRAAESVIFSGYLDNYFVPRGYAVVFADSLGTGDSDGCPTSGAENETQGMRAVVDWLGGRAPGFDAAGRPATAKWSSGKVGMIGVSYNGTLANAVAGTGVKGLETIVPIAAISSWYDYYRAAGGVVAAGGFQGEDTDVLAKAVLTRRDPAVCAGVMAEIERDQDRATGDYGAFWADRDYLHDVDKVHASVLVVHGLNDWNVKTGQFGQWWNALAARGVPRKIWLHQGDHADPFNIRRAAWLDTLHKWFDHWLYGVNNGIMKEPTADIETAPGRWGTHRSWPVPGSVPTTLYLAPGGGLSPKPAPFGSRESFVDDPTKTAEQLLGLAPNRLAYLTPVLKRDTRLSGTPQVTLQASITGQSPYLTALLVDFGSAVRFAGTRQLAEQDCVGPGIPGDPGCFPRREYVTARTPYQIVSRGWLDVRNRHSAAVTEPVVPGHPYVFTWDLEPQDHVFAAGHQVGVVLISTDRAYTLRYPAGTRITADLGLSNVVLPLSNG